MLITIGYRPGHRLRNSVNCLTPLFNKSKHLQHTGAGCKIDTIPMASSDSDGTSFDEKTTIIGDSEIDEVVDVMGESSSLLCGEKGNDITKNEYGSLEKSNKVTEKEDEEDEEDEYVYQAALIDAKLKNGEYVYLIVSSSYFF